MRNLQKYDKCLSYVKGIGTILHKILFLQKKVAITLEIWRDLEYNDIIASFFQKEGM